MILLKGTVNYVFSKRWYDYVGPYSDKRPVFINGQVVSAAHVNACLPALSTPAVTTVSPVTVALRMHKALASTIIQIA